VALALPLSVLAAAAPAGAADIREDVDCEQLDATTEDRYLTDRPSRPWELLDLEAAHALFDPAEGLPGSGVAVAVVDSGVVAGSPFLDVAETQSFTSTPEVLDNHGSVVAGLVAGGPRDGEPTGVAPGARVVDVRVYDQAVPTQDGAVEVQPERVVQGLQWVADNADRLGIRVAVVALRVPDSPALEEAVRTLHEDRDVVVVAASGNRPTEETDDLYSTHAEPVPGEDAVGDVFPAGYTDHVVAVSATAGGHPDAGFDLVGAVLPSSATDVAAPTYGAVSVALNGSTCLLPDVATSWAAAEVAGVVALLRSRYPDDTADQAVARLRETASGAAEDRNVLTGAGVVQPVEALTRPLTPDDGGAVDRSRPEGGAAGAATPPERDGDPLASAREDAVWWGLLGGGTLILALLLRPLLTRLRPPR
jgi:membrane-anchored mycosin MYCP